MLCESRQLYQMDGLCILRYAGTNLLRVLSPRIVIILEDENLLSGEIRRILIQPLASAAHVQVAA